MVSWAKPAAFLRSSSGVMLARSLLFMLCSTLSSIGSPWQSHPGTNAARLPSSSWFLLMKSLRILLSAWPMCRSPLAYGGPSCSTNFSPLPSSTSRS